MSEKNRGDKAYLSYLECEKGGRSQHLVISKDGAELARVELKGEDSFYIIEELVLSLSDMLGYEESAGTLSAEFQREMSKTKMLILKEWFDDSMETLMGHAYQKGYVAGLDLEEKVHAIELQTVSITSDLAGAGRAEKESHAIVRQLAEASTTQSSAKRESILGQREIQAAIRKAVA